MINGIDHIQIAGPVGSEGDMRRFYCDLLGLRDISKPIELQSRGGLWLDCGNMQLHIGIDRHVQDHHLSRRHVAFAVNDIKALRMKLLDAKYIIEDDAAPLPGQTRLYTRDPAGNRVEFVQQID